MTNLESSRASLRELHSLFDDYCAITENSKIDPQRRYDLVMEEKYMGRIKTLFKALDVSPNLDYWGPQILGYEACLDLSASEIKSRLAGLAHLL